MSTPYPMNWKVTYPRTWDKETQSYNPGPIVESFGDSDPEWLLQIIQEAWQNGTELEIEITEWEPSDDDIRSHNEGTTASEMHSDAWEQHVEMHS